MKSYIASQTTPASGNRHERRKLASLARRAKRSCHNKRHATAPQRAICAARLLLAGTIPTQQAAALMFALTAQDVAAASVVLQAEDPRLVERVLAGDICLLDAAAGVKQRAALLAASAVSPVDRIVVSEIVGPPIVPDEPAGPAVDPDDDSGDDDVEALLAEARNSGDIAGYLRKRGFATFGDVVRD
jgi:hypothetical protein